VSHGKKFSEQDLQSILDFPVADVARSVRQAEVAVADQAGRSARNPVGCTTVSAVGEFSTIYVEMDLRIAKHGMVEQVEEFKPELNSRFLAEQFVAVERHCPFLLMEKSTS
jgi:hypothetical protein